MYCCCKGQHRQRRRSTMQRRTTTDLHCRLTNVQCATVNERTAAMILRWPAAGRSQYLPPCLLPTKIYHIPATLSSREDHRSVFSIRFISYLFVLVQTGLTVPDRCWRAASIPPGLCCTSPLDVLYLLHAAQDLGYPSGWRKGHKGWMSSQTTS